MLVLGGAGRAAVRGEVRRRRSWTAAEKRRIVAETFEPGASVSTVARRHDLNANLLFTWRRQAGLAEAVGAPAFVPAILADELSPVPSGPVGRMEIVLVGGDQVIVGPDVDAAVLARVIKALSRR